MEAKKIAMGLFKKVELVGQRQTKSKDLRVSMMKKTPKKFKQSETTKSQLRDKLGGRQAATIDETKMWVCNTWLTAMKFMEKTSLKSPMSLTTT